MNILFLEDEPTIREVLTEYMKMQNYNVTCAEDGGQALELLAKKRFDMAVLDIMVPKVNGLDVLQYIKEHQPETATIILTALDDEKTQVQAFNSYADDYVIKPVSPIILLKRMETILRRVKRLKPQQEKGLAARPDNLSSSPRAYMIGEKQLLQYSQISSSKVVFKLGMVAHAFNPSTREAEAGGFLSSRPAWSTK